MGEFQRFKQTTDGSIKVILEERQTETGLKLTMVVFSVTGKITGELFDQDFLQEALEESDAKIINIGLSLDNATDIDYVNFIRMGKRVAQAHKVDELLSNQRIGDIYIIYSNPRSLVGVGVRMVEVLGMILNQRPIPVIDIEEAWEEIAKKAIAEADAAK